MNIFIVYGSDFESVAETGEINQVVAGIFKTEKLANKFIKEKQKLQKLIKNPPIPWKIFDWAFEEVYYNEENIDDDYDDEDYYKLMFDMIQSRSKNKYNKSDFDLMIRVNAQRCFNMQYYIDEIGVIENEEDLEEIL
jgi:hypothetical protein